MALVAPDHGICLPSALLDLHRFQRLCNRGSCERFHLVDHVHLFIVTHLSVNAVLVKLF